MLRSYASPALIYPWVLQITLSQPITQPIRGQAHASPLPPTIQILASGHPLFWDKGIKRPGVFLQISLLGKERSIS